MKFHLRLAIVLLLYPAYLLAAPDAGMVETKIRTITLDPNTQAPVIVLESVTDKRLLPIWIDVAEARAIAIELERVKTPRPLTHDLMRNILVRLGATLERAVITELRNNTYYALLHLRLKGQEFRIDARPSDAIALALRMKTPIFASLQVFAKAEAVPAPTRSDAAHRVLGIQAQDLTRDLAALLNIASTGGVVVADVEVGGPAASAGMQRGDIITKANNTMINSTADLERFIRATKTPAQLRLEVIKKGKSMIVVIDLPK
jgi:bifunctional DNase/RNase